MRVFSLFSGIGGFELGIEKAYSGLSGNRQKDIRLSVGQKAINGDGNHNSQTKRSQPSTKHSPCAEFVGYSEINKPAISVYEKHFPEVKNFGSVDRISTDDVPDFDLLTFGWPCQDNSIAGKRKGQVVGTRSGLLFEAIRILRSKQPKYFIAENVPGLFSVNGGRDFYEAIRLFTDIGYDCQWQVLNTRWFLPQNRERIYIVGHLRTGRRPEIFPIGEDGQTHIYGPGGGRTKSQTCIFSHNPRRRQKRK